MVWADFHNRDLLIEAGLLSSSRSAALILSNFSSATSWDLLELEMHEFRLLHVWLTLTTVFVTEGLGLSIWVPVIMRLDMSMIFIERVIQVTVDPG